MSPELLTFLQFHGINFLFKIGFLTLVFLFFLFYIVVFKQIKSMNTIVTQPDLFPYLQTIVAIMLTAIAVLFVVGIVIL